MGGDIAVALAAQHDTPDRCASAPSPSSAICKFHARQLGAEAWRNGRDSGAPRATRTATSSTSTASPACGEMRTCSSLAPSPSTISKPTLRKSPCRRRFPPGSARRPLPAPAAPRTWPAPVKSSFSGVGDRDVLRHAEAPRRRATRPARPRSSTLPLSACRNAPAPSPARFGCRRDRTVPRPRGRLLDRPLRPSPRRCPASPSAALRSEYFHSSTRRCGTPWRCAQRVGALRACGARRASASASVHAASFTICS